MLELTLYRVEAQLRNRARETMWWGFVLAGGLGLLLHLLVWVSPGSTATHAGASLLLASVMVVPGVLMIRRGRRRPELIERLRREPREVRALTLRWVAGLRGTHGELGFQFRPGDSCYVTLPTETARTAFQTFRVAYPWARAAVRVTS
jgi:hypothetical protein